MIRQVLFAHLLCFATGVIAEIHKCADGVFTDKPCPGEERRTLAYPVPRPLPVLPAKGTATVDFAVETSTYPVHGSTYSEVIVAMRQHNPYAGRKRWQVAPKFVVKSSAGSCVVDSVEFKISNSILMPDWTEITKATAQDRMKWNEAIATLKAHEDTHAKHEQEFGDLLGEKIMAIRPQPCGQITFSAFGVLNTLLAELEQRETEYDIRTEYGLRKLNPR